LRNVIERGMILAGGDTDTLCCEHLLPEIGAGAIETTPGPQPPKGAAVPLPVDGLRLGEVERDLVRQALTATEGNQVRAARLLGISRDALRNRMKKFGLLPSA
jgi:DNA-binding NtrC family response regulator